MEIVFLLAFTQLNARVFRASENLQNIARHDIKPPSVMVHH